MKVRSVLLVATLAAVSFIGLSVGSPAAQAHDSGPTTACIGDIETSWGLTCYESNGDDQWVFDKSGNGWGVRVRVETDYGKTRWCVDPHRAGFWHECNYDHREQTCVRFGMFEQLGEDNTQTRNWTGWSDWFSTGGVTFCPLAAEPTAGPVQPTTARQLLLR